MKQVIAILFLSTVLFSCQYKTDNKTVDTETEKKIIEETIKNTIAWAKDKDTSLLYSIIANDSNYLEVHPSINVVKGISQFKQAERFWLDSRFKHITFEVWDMNINISQDADVAWFFCMLNDINDWDGQSASWENTRWTGVLEKRNGNWRMVQMHFSNPKE
ncbi:MAG: nuclear transport factor 2 family protein [Bacteroidales bacterium]|nr:nuclear transport factor 2 family protein [Bacteroidales bacterium]